MEIRPLNKTTFPSLRLSYDLDPTLNVSSDNFENEQNLDILLSNFLSNARDESSNKYSNFYLTDRVNLSRNIEFKELANPAVEIFTTWLASDADKQLNTKTDFWTVGSDIAGATTLQDVAASGIFVSIDNTYIFDVQLLNEKICRVAHTYNNYTRYLTINYLNATGNSFFCLDNGQDPFDANSTQSFCYLYDRKNDFIVLYKLINDVAHIVYTFETTKDVSLAIPLTSDDFGFTNDQIYRCRARFESATKPIVDSMWVQYEKNFKNNKLTIDDRPSPQNLFCPSYASVDTNFLINTEYYNLSGNALPINILTLKNTTTPNNYQSKNNPFSVREPEIQQRQYRKLFTGTNQVGGYDSIKLGYETFTSQRKFEPDKLTYFHTPQDFFPYLQLNVQDTGLIESGAIAGNHPLRSDKIFKKKAGYKYTSPFGDTSNEQNGTFLCAWLSGSDNITNRPIWVDRYYFPDQTNYLAAMTATTNPFINYTSETQGLRNELPFIKQVVVDIPSRLAFEPGTLYAYHHIGKNTINQLISNFNYVLFEKNLDTYTNTTYDILTGEPVESEQLEYMFDGNRYGKTTRVAEGAPNNFNEFTLNFYMHVDDWQSNFSNQIIGNYVNDGVGVYNTNYVTPFITLLSPSAVNIFNTDGVLADRKSFNAKVSNMFKYDQCEDYFVVKADNTIARVNTDSVVLDTYNFGNIGSSRSIYPFNDNLAFVLTGNASSSFYCINTDTGGLSGYNQTPYLYDAANIIDFTNTGFLNILTHKKQIYILQGYSPQILNNDIYFSWNNFIWQYNTITKERYSAYKFNTLIDFNIDFDGNLWALHDTNKVSKLETTIEKNVLFTKTLDLSGTLSNIDLLSYFEGNSYKKEMLVYSRLSGTNASLRMDKLQYDGAVVMTTLLPSYLSASVTDNNNITSKTDTTGGDYARYYVKEQYPQHNLSAKIRLRNVYNYGKTKKIDLKFNLSAVDVGYHHVSVRVDTYKGIMSMFFDGELVANQYFEENNFIFNNLLKEPFYAGATPSFNNKLLATRLRQNNTFFTNNTKLKNIYLYKKPLDYYQIGLHVKQALNFYPLSFDLPSGRRNILDEIEYVFKNKVPGFKTGIFDLEVKNTGITDAALKSTLEKQIKQTLQGCIPSYTKLRNIIWRESDAS